MMATVFLSIALMIWFLVTQTKLGGHRPSSLTACKQVCNHLAAILDNYASDHAGRYPANLRALVKTGYLKELPTCPAAHKCTYAYHCSSNPDAFTFKCAGDNHHDQFRRQATFEGSSAGLPGYTSEHGIIHRPRPAGAP